MRQRREISTLKRELQRHDVPAAPQPAPPDVAGGL
jgi:hypothetical protein